MSPVCGVAIGGSVLGSQLIRSACGSVTRRTQKAWLHLHAVRKYSTMAHCWNLGHIWQRLMQKVIRPDLTSRGTAARIRKSIVDV